MWYKCLNGACGFVFSWIGECTQCPDCGKEALHEAETKEIEEQKKYLTSSKDNE